MLSFLPVPLLVALNVLLASLNLLFWGGLIVVAALMKLLPIKPLQRTITDLCNGFMSCWVQGNALILQLTTKTQLRIHGLDDHAFSKQSWYLILANHLSWADIIVITIALRDRVPMLKFFLKQQLFYIPVLGLACWALDMPFMHRYSKSQLIKNPKLKGKDIKNTQKSCEKFKIIPTCVINFVEGSRLTQEKHQRQKSPYRYLMKPKAGGIAFALNTLGSQFDQLIDVTLVYPDAPSHIMWGLASGQLSTVHVAIRTLPLSQVPTGNYEQDKAFRVQFQQWLNQLWQQKDEQIHQVLAEHQAQTPFYSSLSPAHN